MSDTHEKLNLSPLYALHSRRSGELTVFYVREYLITGISAKPVIYIEIIQ